jgi:isopenicillin-N N-acyltransferase-like protein
MKVFEYEANRSARERGRAHGEAFRGMIAEVAAIRMELCLRVGGFDSDAQVRAIAKDHLPILDRFDRELGEELAGIAEGAAISIEDAVVLNHYTDLRDLGPKTGKAEEECSAVYARDGSTLLGQTWDMHGSAEGYVMMLRVPERGDRPAAWLLSITGCLGMTGLNSRGIGITINNLKSLDARPGIVWPALVRRTLDANTVEDARDTVLEAPLGSGHHYLVASAHAAYGIETSGTERKIVFTDEHQSSASVFVHTNHCLDPVVAEKSTTVGSKTTVERYDVLSHGIDERPIFDRVDLWARLGSHETYPRAVCTHMATAATPHESKTCGGLAMDLRARDVWAASGCLHHARAHVFAF